VRTMMSRRSADCTNRGHSRHTAPLPPHTPALVAIVDTVLQIAWAVTVTLATEAENRPVTAMRVRTVM
jgi:hypothetical protein